MFSMNSFATNGFAITVGRIPNFEFRAQRVEIPGITTNPPTHPTPFKQLYSTPDTITYGPLVISFILDENFDTYFELSKWIKGVSFPENFDQFKDLKSSSDGLRSSMSVHMLNSKMRPHIVMNVEDAFPSDIGQLSLSLTESETLIATVDVTFTFNTFNIEKIIRH